MKINTQHVLIILSVLILIGITYMILRTKKCISETETKIMKKINQSNIESYGFMDQLLKSKDYKALKNIQDLVNDFLSLKNPILAEYQKLGLPLKLSAALIEDEDNSLSKALKNIKKFIEDHRSEFYSFYQRNKDIAEKYLLDFGIRLENSLLKFKLDINDKLKESGVSDRL